MRRGRLTPPSRTAVAPRRLESREQEHFGAGSRAFHRSPRVVRAGPEELTRGSRANLDRGAASASQYLADSKLDAAFRA
jgi:hypothetical protein